MSAEDVRRRQDGDYEVPVLAEPQGGLIPPWNPPLPPPAPQED